MSWEQPPAPKPLDQPDLKPTYFIKWLALIITPILIFSLYIALTLEVRLDSPSFWLMALDIIVKFTRGPFIWFGVAAIAGYIIFFVARSLGKR